MRESQQEEAVELGVVNRRAVGLLANHCRHARVELVHGTSMVGQVLDLPIGMAQVRCQYADQPRVMSMHVTNLAVDFYESNCVGCRHREPNGLLPTIANLADERRQCSERAVAKAAVVHAAAVAAWEARRGARRRAVVAEGYPARDLVDDLDLLDPHPDTGTDGRELITAARRRIVETARRAPEVFTRRLVETVIDLAVCNLDRTACMVLRLLARSGVVEPGVAVDVAAKVLATVPLVEAGQTVAELAAEATLGLLKAALPNVISLAAEHDDFPGGGRTPEPAALLAISNLDLPAVTDAVVTQLDDDDETRRAEAADAAAVLLRVDSRRVVVLGRALARSIREQDQGYAGTPRPCAAAAKAPAEAWRGSPEITAMFVEAEAPALTEDGRGELFKVIRFLHRWRDDIPISDAAAAKAAAFSVRRLSGDWGGTVADRAAEELEDLASKYPAAVLPQTEALLAALLSLCSLGQVSPLLVPDVPDKNPLSDELKVLQDMAAYQSRANRTRKLAKALGRLAHHDSARVLPAVISMLGASTGDADLDATTRASLVAVLAESVTVMSVAEALPILYTCLLSTEQVVRAAAIDLWEACARSADELPSELAELATALLADPYVIVHAAMLWVLPSLGLPDRQASELLHHFAAWAQHYSDKDERRLEDALYGVLWAAHRSGDEEIRHNAAVWVTALSEHLHHSHRERLLLDKPLDGIRPSALWARAAVESLADPERHDRFNMREDELLAALLEEPRGLNTLPVSLFRAISNIYLPHFAAAAAEPVELLQTVGRYADAAALAVDLAAAVRDTREYRSTRWYLSAVAAACTGETAAMTDVPAPALPSAPEQDETSAVDDEPVFLIHTRSRLAARDALAIIPVPDPAVGAAVLDSAAAIVTDAAVSPRVRWYGAALAIGSHLLRYDAAVRVADPAATAHLSAARRAATVLTSSFGSSMLEYDLLREFVTGAETASTDTVDSLLGQLRRVPAPLPLVAPVTYRRFRGSPASSPEPDELASSMAAEADRPLAVCVLSLDDQPVVDVVVVRTGHVYDLGIDIRFDAWPDWADQCHVSLLTVLSPDALAIPEFTFTRADLTLDDHGATLSGNGTLRCMLERPAGRPPLDLPVHIQFSATDGRRELAEVGGYRRLRVRPYDPSRDAFTEHTQIDQRLLELYDPLHDDPSLDQDDVRAFCRLFTACVRAAQAIMFDGAFRSGRRVTEQQFHDDLERRLRLDPELGGRLTRRDPIAGGFADLLHDDVVAELKVEKRTPRTVEECVRYLGQPTHYGVGRGSRLSILVVLDHTRKTAPPAVLENYIDWLHPAHHGRDDPRYPSRVGVLIINTNWPPPSAWSRRRIATRVDSPEEAERPDATASESEP